MASFNKFERYLSGVLSGFPQVKRNAKYYYQAIQRRLHPSGADFTSEYPVERITPANRHCFFGYYDVCPENPETGKVLYHSLDETGLKVNLCLFHREQNAHKIIGESEAFNFQFGSRLQWVDEKKIIYNTYGNESGRYESICYDLSDGSTQTHPYPVLSLHKESFYAIDFGHLGNIGSEYGYHAHKVRNAGKEPAYGILSVSLRNHTTHEIVSVAEVIKDHAVASGKHICHFINHFMLSPDGTHAVFLHRWTHDSGRSEHLWIMDMSNLQKEILHRGMTSHYCWKNDTQLVAYLTSAGETGYFLIDITTRSFTPIHNMNLTDAGDGHPATSGTDTIVFDSYPDRSGMQSLYLYRQNEVTMAGKFFAPLHKDPYYRTDLHPRISNDGRRVYIDSNHEAKRGLYCLSI